MNSRNVCIKMMCFLCVLLFHTAFVWAGGSGENKGVTVQYWNINSDTFGGPQVASLIESFKAENPGVTVEARSFDSYPSLLQAAETSIAGGNPPDVIQVAYPYLSYVASSLPFMPIGDLVDEFGGEEFLNQFPKNILDIPTVGGRQIGMAYSLSIPVAYYNADLMVKAGLDPDNPPQSIDQWIKAGEIIKNKLGIATVIWGYNEDNWTVQGFINSAGGELLGCKNGKVTAVFDEPAAVRGVETWRSLIKAGYSMDLNYSEARQAFLAGEAVCYVHSIAARSGIQRDAGFDLRATTYPQIGNNPIRVPGGGNMLVIFSKEKQKKNAAWQFVQHLCSPRGFTEWTKGTGYVPLIPGLTDDPAYLAEFVRENPIQQVGIDMLKNAVTWVSFPGPNGMAAGRELFEATEKILAGTMDTEQALEEAATKVDVLIGNETCQ
ncbi:MAG: ABC transporter substrate-binding protein [Spirochaetales bacterium]|nr:ABC transporter substrate-binding protein [Spirochaetales bacterium]